MYLLLTICVAGWIDLSMGIVDTHGLYTYPAPGQRHDSLQFPLTQASRRREHTTVAALSSAYLTPQREAIVHDECGHAGRILGLGWLRTYS